MMDSQEEVDAPYSEEHFGRPTAAARIFVSSHMGRRNVLRAERETAAAAIESTGFARPWSWEHDAHAGPYCSERICVGTAATSDGLVLILARKLTRVTLKEYKAAYAAGVPCFIFIKQGVRRDPDVNAFITQERQHTVTESFGNLAELRTRIVQALYTYFVSAVRWRALQARLYRVRSEPALRRGAVVADLADTGGRRYETIELAVETDDGFKSAAQVVAEARDAVAAGQVVAAFEALNDLAVEAQETGLPDVALELVEELQAIVPGSALTEEQRAWLLNTEGLARMGLGEYERATRLFDRMRAAGERLGDDLLLSTALHNLGILAVFRREPKQAIDLYRRSLALKRKVGDYYGLAQVFLNLAAPMIDSGKGEDAEQMLHDLERLIRSIHDPDLLVSLHGNLGQIAAKHGHFEIAQRRFHRALELARGSAANPRKELIALQNLGSLELGQGRPARALRWYRKALEIAEQLHAPSELELTHRSLGLALHALNRHKEAAAEFEQAAAVIDHRGGSFLWAENTANVGALRITLEEIDVAIPTLNQALDVFRIIGDTQWQARVLENLAVAKQTKGDSAGAFVSIDDAAGLLAEAPEECANLLRHGAELAIATGQTARATDYLKRELEAAEVEPSRQRAWRAATAGALLRQGGAPAEAVTFYDRAVRIYERLGEQELLYSCVNDRALAYSDQELYQEARRDLSRCLRLARRRDDRTMEQQALGNLGETDRREGRIRNSLQRLEKALELAHALRDADAEAWTLGNLGLALLDSDRWDEAQGVFLQMLTLGRSLRKRQHEATAVAGLARIALHQGRKAEAARLYRRAVGLQTEQDRRHLVGNLAGLVEALAALGREQELEREVQRLIDLGQANGYEEVAINGLVRAAWRLLQRREREDAAYYYATAIVIAGVSALSAEECPAEEGSIDEATADAFARALVEPATHLIRAGETLERSQADAFYGLVADKADEHAEGFGEIVRPLLKDAAKAFRDEDS
jgi:tetratricopeptide (TPR) repeat protein